MAVGEHEAAEVELAAGVEAAGGFGVAKAGGNASGIYGLGIE